MKGQGGGGTAKGGGKNKTAGQTVKVETTVPRQTKAINDNIVALRAALFEENGKDKDVTKDIAKSFMKYDRNGLDLSIEFATKLSKGDANWAFELVKENMEDKYDSSGYGWDDEDKMKELTENGTRFLVAREGHSTGAAKGKAVGFVHFRFTVQGEVIDQMAGEPSLYIYDIHIEDHAQRKGLGKHLLMILELIARREKMKVLSLPVQNSDVETRNWIAHIGRGWAVDESLSVLGFDADLEGFTVHSKLLGEIKRTAVQPTPAAAAQVVTPAATAATASAVSAAPTPATTVAAAESSSVFAAAASAAVAAVAALTSVTATAVEDAPVPGLMSPDLKEVEGGWVCV